MMSQPCWSKAMALHEACCLMISKSMVLEVRKASWASVGEEIM